MPPIADKLDAAIGAAPPEAPALDTTLVLGRRALRRRRMAYGVGAAATALVIGGTTWALSPGDGHAPRTDDDFVAVPSDPAPGDATDRTRTPPPTPPVPWHGEAARVDRQGRLEVKLGWRVTQDLSTLGVTAVEVSNGDRKRWYLFGDRVVFSPDGTAPGYASFRAWVDVNIPIILDMKSGRDTATPDGDWPGVPRDDLVAFGGGEDLVALAGVAIVEQRPSPDVGPSFASANEISAVALVAKNGERWYVLARDVNGPPQYIAVPERKGGADLDAFLELARERYAEGGGGLL